MGDELARRYPNLAEHLRFLTLELRAGKSRKESWSSFAERLNIPQLSGARKLTTEGGMARIERQTDGGYWAVEAPLPAIVSTIFRAVVLPSYAITAREGAV